ncbi:MAG: pirin family protein [Candidatus Limnocylindria bacterium]
MIELRPPEALFHVEGGWFSANWHFSFDTYRDAANTQFGDLRVFNDDRLVPGAIWPMHPHRDIEGITYVAEGTFRHADSMGNGGVLNPGSVQRATLGSGMMHSEQNGSDQEPMRFIQMWIMPAELGLPPSVEQVEPDAAEWRRRHNALVPVLVPAEGFGTDGAPSPGAGAVTVHQDAAMHAGRLDANAEVAHQFREGFGGYLFVVHGSLAAVGDAASLAAGGAAKISGEAAVTLPAGADGAEIILVETRTG